MDISYLWIVCMSLAALVHWLIQFHQSITLHSLDLFVWQHLLTPLTDFATKICLPDIDSSQQLQLKEGWEEKEYLRVSPIMNTRPTTSTANSCFSFPSFQWHLIFFLFSKLIVNISTGIPSQTLSFWFTRRFLIKLHVFNSQFIYGACTCTSETNV